MLHMTTADTLQMNNANKEEQHQYTIYVDMDGVLADFAKMGTKLMREAGHHDFNYEMMNVDKKTRNEIWSTITAYQKKHGYVVWRNLELMPDAHVLMNYVKPYHPQILTATGQPQYHSAEQKRAWVTENFGSNIRVNTVQMAKEKAQFADPTRILIDDQRKALDPWVAAGGIGILHKNAASTIRQLKDLGL